MFKEFKNEVLEHSEDPTWMCPKFYTPRIAQEYSVTIFIFLSSSQRSQLLKNLKFTLLTILMYIIQYFLAYS